MTQYYLHHADNHTNNLQPSLQQYRLTNIIMALTLASFIRLTVLFASSSYRVSALSMGNIANEQPTLSSLLDRSQRLREKLYGNDSVPSFVSDKAQLSYPSSSYMMAPDPRSTSTKTVSRGFCNWLLPNFIMIGQYPGMTPESNGPSQKECNIHIKNMVCDANVTLFCCLQSEVPCQSDDAGWKSDEVYLEQYYRREFPRPFTRYGGIAQELTNKPIQFLFNPIEDLSVPSCNNSLLDLLSRLIQYMEENNTEDGSNVIYIHCWGGRGRAGLIGSCLVSLLFPELSPTQVLDFVQSAYSTRAGAESMPLGLRQSPQTEQQRMFVKEFVNFVKEKSLSEK